MSIPEWAQEGPPLILFLFIVVTSRAQGTYWLARAIPELVARKHEQAGPRLQKVAAWLNGPVPKKGKAILEKWGVIALPASFLTVGLQTAVLAGAGMVRMRWLLFTIMIFPGTVVWALIYGYGLLAVWTTVVGALAGSPIAWVIILVAVGSLWLWTVRRSKPGHQSRPQIDAVDH